MGYVCGIMLPQQLFRHIHSQLPPDTLHRFFPIVFELLSGKFLDWPVDCRERFGIKLIGYKASSQFKHVLAAGKPCMSIRPYLYDPHYLSLYNFVKK